MNLPQSVLDGLTWNWVSHILIDGAFVVGAAFGFVCGIPFGMRFKEKEICQACKKEYTPEEWK